MVRREGCQLRTLGCAVTTVGGVEMNFWSLSRGPAAPRAEHLLVGTRGMAGCVPIHGPSRASRSAPPWGPFGAPGVGSFRGGREARRGPRQSRPPRPAQGAGELRSRTSRCSQALGRRALVAGRPDRQVPRGEPRNHRLVHHLQSRGAQGVAVHRPPSDRIINEAPAHQLLPDPPHARLSPSSPPTRNRDRRPPAGVGLDDCTKARHTSWCRSSRPLNTLVGRGRGPSGYEICLGPPSARCCRWAAGHQAPCPQTPSATSSHPQTSGHRVQPIRTRAKHLPSPDVRPARYAETLKVPARYPKEMLAVRSNSRRSPSPTSVRAGSFGGPAGQHLRSAAPAAPAPPALRRPAGPSAHALRGRRPTKRTQHRDRLPRGPAVRHSPGREIPRQRSLAGMEARRPLLSSAVFKNLLGWPAATPDAIARTAPEIYAV